MTAADWSRFRKCPVCFAELGQPCTSLTGGMSRSGPAGTWKPIEVPRDAPHVNQKRRTRAAQP